MLQFLNPALLFGALLLAVPLIIHLLNRQRHKRRPWAAMEFLLAAYKKQRRRLRRENLLLLLLRCAIPVILALAIARPMLREDSAFGSSTAPVHHILVLDQSYSMKLELSGSTTPHQRAKEMAGRLLERIAERDANRRVTLVLAGLRPQIPLRDEIDLRRAMGRIAALPPPADAAAPLTDALIQVADLVEEAPEGAEVRVHLFTDLQVRAFGEDLLETATVTAAVTAPDQPSAEMFRDSSTDAIERIRARAEITVFDLRGSGDGGLEDNVQVVDIEIATGQAIRAVPVPVIVTLRNRTDRSQSLQVTLEIDGSQPTRRAVTIDAGADGEAMFEVMFHELGRRRLTASIEGDSLPTDDRRFRVVDVRDRLAVLVVEGSGEDEPSLRESTQLLEILDPTDGEGPPDLTQFAPQVVDTVSFLSGHADPADYDLVVLANVERLNAEVTRKLEAAVESGTGLLVMFGEGSSVDSYNLHLNAAGEGLMPLLLEREEGFAVDGDRYYGSTVEAPEHPVFRDFEEDVYLELLQNLPVWRFVGSELQLPPAANLPGASLPGSDGQPSERALPEVLARLNDARRSPLLVASRRGAGKAVFLTSAISRRPGRWNRFDTPAGGLSFMLLWPLAQWLTLPAEDYHNVEVGAVLSAVMRGRPTDLAVVPPEDAELAKIPIGDEARPLPGGRYALPPFRRTQRAGFYDFEMLLEGEGGDQQRRVESFAVNPEVAEGELAYLSHEAARRRLGVDAIRTSLPAPDDTGLAGGIEELGPLFLLLTLLLVLGEASLARWISGRRS